jgi:hypothetical protein
MRLYGISLVRVNCRLQVVCHYWTDLRRIGVAFNLTTKVTFHMCIISVYIVFRVAKIMESVLSHLEFKLCTWGDDDISMNSQ